jgi:hypothetical protein
MRKDGWTLEQTQLARDLFASRATEAEFRNALGRSKGAALEHLRWKDDPAYRETRNVARTARRATARGYRSAEIVGVPERLRHEANERASAPQTLTGFVFGDPPIGYRAIDRKREQETA